MYLAKRVSQDATREEASVVQVKVMMSCLVMTGAPPYKVSPAVMPVQALAGTP